MSSKQDAERQIAKIAVDLRRSIVQELTAKDALAQRAGERGQTEATAKLLALLAPTEPTGREEILEYHVEEARRERDGLPPVCARCERDIGKVAHLYRCAECGMAFHLWCIRAHFAEHQDAAPTESPEPEAIETLRGLGWEYSVVPLTDGREKRWLNAPIAQPTEEHQPESELEGWCWEHDKPCPWSCESECYLQDAEWHEPKAPEDECDPDQPESEP